MVNTGYLDEAVPLLRNHLDAFSGYEARQVLGGVTGRRGERVLEGSGLS